MSMNMSLVSIKLSYTGLLYRSSIKLSYTGLYTGLSQLVLLPVACDRPV